MKFRLTGIFEAVYEEELGNYSSGDPMPPLKRSLVVARLEREGTRGHAILDVQYEMVRGAEIGDEFTLHLERVKK